MTLAEEVTGWRVKQTALSAAQTHAGQERQACMDALQTTESGLDRKDTQTVLVGALPVLELVASGKHVLALDVARKREGACEELLAAVHARHVELEVRLAGAEAQEETLGHLRNELDKVREEKAQADADVLQASEKQEQERLTVERLQREGEAFERELDHSTNMLGEDILRFGGLAGMPLALPDRLEWLQVAVSALEERKEAWQALQAERQQRMQAVTLLAQHCEQLGQREIQLREECSRLRLQAVTQRGALDALVGERQALMSEPDVDVVEQTAQEAFLAAQQASGRSDRDHQEALHQRDAVLQRISDKTSGVGARAIQLTDREARFVQRLQELGFADEVFWQAARLPESERKRLAGTAQALEREQHILSSRTREVERLLLTEKEKALSSEPVESLRSLAAEWTHARTALLQEMGEVRARIRADRELRERQAERIAAMEAQRSECERWSRLHTLIGSADGK
jgi:exonuclease SbcC